MDLEVAAAWVWPGSILSESLAGWADSVGIDGSDPYAVMAGIDEHFGHPAHLTARQHQRRRR